MDKTIFMEYLNAYNEFLNQAEEMFDKMYDMLEAEYGEGKGSAILHDDLQLFSIYNKEFHFLDEVKAREVLENGNDLR